MKLIFKSSLLILGSAFLISCTHGQCSNVPQRPTDDQIKKNLKEEEPALPAPANDSFLTIYKDSGMKQCEAKSGVSIEVFKSRLTKAGVQVLEARTQSDGQMRIQKCGAGAGQIHVFVIEKKFLKKAEKQGFKILK